MEDGTYCQIKKQVKSLSKSCGLQAGFGQSVNALNKQVIAMKAEDTKPTCPYFKKLGLCQKLHRLLEKGQRQHTEGNGNDNTYKKNTKNNTNYRNQKDKKPKRVYPPYETTKKPFPTLMQFWSQCCREATSMEKTKSTETVSTPGSAKQNKTNVIILYLHPKERRLAN